MTALIILFALAIAFEFYPDLIDFCSKPKQSGKTHKRAIAKSQLNLMDFLFKPKEAGKPYKPRIRWRR
jgi:hypothetical protein